MKNTVRDYASTFDNDNYIEEITEETVANGHAKKEDIGKYFVWTPSADMPEPETEEEAVNDWKKYLNDTESDYYREYGRDNTNLELSDKAEKVYADTDPLKIVETMSDGDYVYAISGVVDRDGMTAEDVNDLLESFANEN